MTHLKIHLKKAYKPKSTTLKKYYKVVNAKKIV